MSHLRRADDTYALIKNGDKIAVGVSGGKDSLTLLHALSVYQKFGLKQFEIIAVTVDCTNGKADYGKVADFCADLGVKYHVEPSEIFAILFDARKEKNPCSLCSKLRNGMLNTAAKRLGCNKVALAHHGDDLVETFLLCMTHEGRLSTFHPVMYLSKADLTLIRPLVYVTEREIIAASRGYPVLENPCPVNHKTRREYMKELITRLDRDIPDSRERMLDAIISVNRYNLFDKIDNTRDN